MISMASGRMVSDVAKTIAGKKGDCSEDCGSTRRKERIAVDFPVAWNLESKPETKYVSVSAGKMLCSKRSLPIAASYCCPELPSDTVKVPFIPCPEISWISEDRTVALDCVLQKLTIAWAIGWLLLSSSF